MDAPIGPEAKFEQESDPCYGCDLACPGCAFDMEPLYVKRKLIDLGWDSQQRLGTYHKKREDKNKIWEELIPPGPYCYTFDYLDPDRLKRKAIEEGKPVEELGIPVVNCPHSTTKEINGINVPWCQFTNRGSIGVQNDDNFAKLVEYFGSEDNVFDNLSADCLDDSYKCCGMGGDYNFTEKEAIEWIRRVKEYE